MFFKGIVFLSKEGMEAGSALSIAAGTWRAWAVIRSVFKFSGSASSDLRPPSRSNVPTAP